MLKRVSDKPVNAPVKPGELTAPQVGYIIGMQELYTTYPAGVTYDTYRELRKDPTIALARALVTATAVAGKWSIHAEEDVDDSITSYLFDTMNIIRKQAYRQALEGTIDFGWIGFEKVFGVKEGKIQIRKLKPLYHEMTSILVDENTGDFLGLRQTHPQSYEVNLDKSKALLCNRAVEGTNFYGTPLLENVRKSCLTYDIVDEGATKYDRQIAGSHFIVYYPDGTSFFNGRETNNYEIALNLLKALESSGSITVPRSVVEFIDKIDPSQVGWHIEVLEDSGGGKQPQFIERLRYLDVLKVRGMMLPERAVLEGEHGTKAEAGEHGDLFMSNVFQFAEQITDQFNEQVIHQIIALNFGEEYIGKVYIKSSPLVDAAINNLRELYRLTLGNPQGFLQESRTIDFDAIKDQLGIPKADDITDNPADEEGMQKLLQSLAQA